MFETLDHFREALADLPAPDFSFRNNALARQQVLTKPPGSLGRLEDIAVFMAKWSETGRPSAEAVQVVVFAGNHGVTRQNVSPYPSSVTEQMVANFAAGGAAINAITSVLGLSLSVIPLKLDQPTGDISCEAALTEEEFLEALNQGAAAVKSKPDLLILGEMGIGNTTIASALAAASLGGCGADWAGPGTGLDVKGVSHKAQVIDRALETHKAHMRTAADILMRLGGRETAAIAGAVLTARHARIPVILDGYVVCASLAPLFRDNPALLEHCLAGHLSAEPAHMRLLKTFQLNPLLDLQMRLGEGTGAALAASIVRAAVATHNQMATFAEAQVDDRG